MFRKLYIVPCINYSVVNQTLLEVVEGTLLGDASVKVDFYKSNSYFYYKLTAKDKNYLEWMKRLFEKFGIHCWMTHENKISDTHALYFYINNCPFSKQLLPLIKGWFKEDNRRRKKGSSKRPEIDFYNFTLLVFRRR